MIRRREFAALASTAFLGGLGADPVRVLASPPSPDPLRKSAAAIEARLRDLETAARGRLGVHILDTATGKEYGHRADELFMMLSSFKLLASALVLHRVDRGQESLERRIRFGKNELVEWSPVTESHADDREGMSLARLCEATLTTSDNTAANLILASYGGPAALTAYARTLGDTVTRLDRNEPELNVKKAGEALDTTSPRAMVGLMKQIVLGDALSAPSRLRLQQWLLANTTGAKRLRAGLPEGWRIGEKTGTNRTDANDIGVVWPPHRAPLLVSAYLAESQATGPEKEATLAAVGAVVRDLAI